MRRLLTIIILLFLMIQTQISGEETTGREVQPPRPPGPNEVLIAPNGVSAPLGTIILIRKGTLYGAVKFTHFWIGKKITDWYGRYESYYQGDGSGDFSKGNVESRKGEVSFLTPIGWNGIHCARGDSNFRFGPHKLAWSGAPGRGVAYFFHMDQRQSDHGIELAPTKWTDISQVSVSDKRIRWYSFDEKRRDIYIPIDRLWDDGSKVDK